jgi:hypothetical protein
LNAKPFPLLLPPELGQSGLPLLDRPDTGALLDVRLLTWQMWPYGLWRRRAILGEARRLVESILDRLPQAYVGIPFGMQKCASRYPSLVLLHVLLHLCTPPRLFGCADLASPLLPILGKRLLLLLQAAPAALHARQPLLSVQGRLPLPLTGVRLHGPEEILWRHPKLLVVEVCRHTRPT